MFIWLCTFVSLLSTFLLTSENELLSDLRKLDAVIYDAAIMKHFTSTDIECKIKILNELIPDGGYGIAFPKKSVLKLKVSNAIRRYRDSDILTNLENRWLSNVCEEEAQDTVTTSQSEIISFGGLFTVAIGWTVLAFVLFLLEHVVARMKSKKYEINNQISCT